MFSVAHRIFAFAVQIYVIEKYYLLFFRNKFLSDFLPVSSNPVTCERHVFCNHELTADDLVIKRISPFPKRSKRAGSDEICRGKQITSGVAELLSLNRRKSCVGLRKDSACE